MGFTAKHHCERRSKKQLTNRPLDTTPGTKREGFNMAISYRIYTEDKNRQAIKNIVSEKFDGFTLYPCLGYWQGAEEASIVIEIITTCPAMKDDEDKVLRVANKIKLVNEQQAVYITKSNAHLIEV
jgi:hypothetical protein